MAEEWGPWIEHDGKGCPCVGNYARWQFDDLVDVPVGFRDVGGRIVVDGITVEGWARSGEGWLWIDGYCRVIRYRIRKPRGLVLLEELLENLPEKVDA